MPYYRFPALIRDLLNVLPGATPKAWLDLTQIDPKKPTVILVSGFAATHRALWVLRKRLLKDGFNVIIQPMDLDELTDAVDGLYRMSERLSGLLLRLHKEQGMGKNRIYIVAHSAGGLVARHYIQHYGGFHYCKGLITLATPHTGTWYSLLGCFTHLILKIRILYQMLPVSRFIRELNASDYPSHFKMVSIYSKDDLLSSTKRARLPPKLKVENEVKEIEIAGMSHSDFLFSKDVYHLIVKHLRLKEEAFHPVISSPPSI